MIHERSRSEIEMSVEEDPFAKYKGVQSSPSTSSSPLNGVPLSQRHLQETEDQFDDDESKDPDPFRRYSDAGDHEELDQSFGKQSDVMVANDSLDESMYSTNGHGGQQQRANEEPAPETCQLDSLRYGVESFGKKTKCRLGNHGEQEFGAPQKIIGVPFQAVRQVACGEYLSLVLLVNGQVFQWGNGNPKPVPVRFRARVMHIACGYDHLCAITEQETNNLYTWGRNEYGQLGHGHTTLVPAPKAITGFPRETRVVFVTCGCKFTIAVTMMGNMYGFGDNRHGQLGLTDPAYMHQGTVKAPVRIDCLSKIFPDGVGNVDNISEYSRLMVNSGKEHSVSWVASQGAFMQARQQAAFHDLSVRVSELEHSLQTAELTIERLREDNRRLRESKRDAERKGGQDMIVAAAVAAASSSSKLNGEGPRKAKFDVEELDEIPDQLHKDPVVQELTELSVHMENRLHHSEKKLREIQTYLHNTIVDIDDTKHIINVTDSSIHELWDTVEKLGLALNHEKNRHAKRRTRLQQQLLDNEFIAQSGEQSLETEVVRLSALESDLSSLQGQLERERGDWHVAKRVLELLRTQKQDRLKKLGQKFIEKENVIFQWMDAARKILDALQKSDVENMAMESNNPKQETMQQQQGPPQTGGMKALLKASNDKIEDILYNAKDQFRVEDDYAAIEFVSILLSAVQQIGDLRKEVNFYIEHLLGHTEQRISK